VVLEHVSFSGKCLEGGMYPGISIGSFNITEENRWNFKYNDVRVKLS
jgi:hypothetical protein